VDPVVGLYLAVVAVTIKVTLLVQQDKDLVDTEVTYRGHKRGLEVEAVPVVPETTLE
jgi:hypothetical protein